MVLKKKKKSIVSRVGGAALGVGKLGLAVAKKSPVGTALAIGGVALGATGVTKLLSGKKKGKGKRSRSISYFKRKTALLRAKREYQKVRGY